MTVRTRFAPSPTGYLHVGGVRTALFAWLLARQSNGQFILRIEDTDQARKVEDSARHIMDSLRWLGLDWDEGPDKGGPYGPYFQSERLETYRPWAQKLIDSGRAYADPYSPEEVDAFRKQAQAEKRPFLYRDHRPQNPPVWDGSRALRFKSDPKPYSWHDEVMGDLKSGPEVIDDFILIKSDGFPTYNFAHIIDDLNMKVSHVIRSQEFLPSVPKYLNLYEALGIKAPLLATVPFVMGPDGKKKLSKRDGAKDVLDYAREGYLPEALINFMASLGWNDGSTKEIFSGKELIKAFSLKGIQKSGARFDERRLLWMNGSYIRELSTEELEKRSEPFWPEEAREYSQEYRRSVLELVQERMKYLAELPSLTIFFFVDLPINPELIGNNPKLNSLGNDKLKDLLEATRISLEDSNFSVDDLTDRLNKLLEQTGQPPAVLFSLIRIATTQAPSSPPLAESMSLLGKERCLKRLSEQIQAI